MKKITKEEMDRINSGEVLYKYYPKIYFQMLKGFLKSIKYKNKYNIDKIIKENLKEYRNILSKDITNIFSITSSNLIDYKNLDIKMNKINTYINEITKYYTIEYNDNKIIEMFRNPNLKINDTFFKKSNINFNDLLTTSEHLKDISLKEIYEKARCTHFKISENGIITEIDGLMGYWDDYGINN